jgi:hypothetical protein
MGLDMHLYRANLHGHSLRQACLVENYLDLQQWNAAHPDKTYSLMQWSHQDPNEIQPQALQDLEPEFKLGYSYFDTKKAWGLYRIFQECGYWRKANAIHNWFVQNVQNGVDDCDIYLVTREQLEQLKEACEMVLAQVQTKDAQVCVGAHYSNREVSPIMEDGRVITNPESVQKSSPHKAVTSLVVPTMMSTTSRIWRPPSKSSPKFWSRPIGMSKPSPTLPPGNAGRGSMEPRPLCIAYTLNVLISL